MITDLAPYRQYVDQFDLTEEQKLDLVNALWVMLENYFDCKLDINQLGIKEKIDKNTLDMQLQTGIVRNEEAFENIG
jgi:hypothetical protein